MRVNGVDRPWWWSPQRPWVTVALPAVLMITNFVGWYDDRSTFHLVGWIMFLLFTIVGIASVLATRRRIQWESREF